MTPEYDGSLQLKDYWEKHRGHIARHRKWVIQPKEDDYSCENCATLRQYNNYIQNISGYLTMPMSEITLLDIFVALAEVARENQYKEQTVKTIISALRDVFSYASTCGHAYNILRGIYAGDKAKNYVAILLLRQMMAPAAASLTENGAGGSCTSSLTIAQQGRLARYAAKCVLEDGRFCGLLLSLYTGMRPAECRGLRWSDLQPFPDHPERYFLQIDKILNQEKKYSKRVKTKNALRRIPVHIEIVDYLCKRREFVQQKMGEDTDIGELPIVCLKNEITTPCSGCEYSNFVFEQLEKFGVSDKQIGFTALEAVAQKENDDLVPSDSHPPLRILRRNFAALIQSSTDLTLEEKEYIFGHRMSGKDGAKRRREYSQNMNRLWCIAQKLDKAIVCYPLHERHIARITVGQKEAVQEGHGIYTVTIPREAAVRAQQIWLSTDSKVPNVALTISTPNTVRQLGGLPVQAEMTSIPVTWGDQLPPVNAEAIHLEAAMQVQYKERKK